MLYQNLNPFGGFFRNWQRLQQVECLADQAFLWSEIPKPAAADSDHQRADRFTALLSGPLPPMLAFHLREIQSACEELIADFSVLAMPLAKLSFTHEAAAQCVLTTVRRAGFWYQDWLSRGSHPDIEWSAYLIGPGGQNLRTLIERLLKNGFIFPIDDIECMGEHGLDRSDQLNVQRTQRQVWNCVRQLPAREQRFLRLRAGMFPARPRNPRNCRDAGNHQCGWSSSRIGSVFSVDENFVESTLNSAMRNLERLLLESGHIEGEECFEFWV